MPHYSAQYVTKRMRGTDYYGPWYYVVCGMECCVCGSAGWWAHHVKSVGAGGLDAENCAPLCMAHHAEVENIGRKTFEKKYGVDLETIAKEIA